MNVDTSVPKETVTGVTFTGELIVGVTGYMPGELKDWPANIQDEIYAALERYKLAMRQKYQIPTLTYDVVRSQCDFDIDEGFYVIVYVKARITVQ